MIRSLLILLIGLLVSSCSTRYQETVDPATGMVIERDFKTYADLNAVTSGDLSSASQGGSILGIIPTGRRGTVVSQVAVTEALDGSRPTMKIGEMEFYGTMVHSSPAAVAWRGLTGVAREIRQGVVWVTGINAWETDKLAGHSTDQAKVAADAQVATSEITGATDIARIDADVATAEIAAEAAAIPSP